MDIKRLIPNFFTMLNLFCGCVALERVAYLDFERGFYFVCLGIFFDFFDGFFARKFGVAGPLGVQLDSLADMVTSGVVPGFVMYQLLRMKRVEDDINGFAQYIPNDNDFYFVFLGFMITLGACYRLAKFNIDTRQSDSFIGLPTPANSLFITSLPLVIAAYPASVAADLLSNPLFLLSITALSAYAMNAEIPLFSLKIKQFSFDKYKLQLFFVFLCAVMLVLLQVVAVPLIILMYVLLSILDNQIKTTVK
ncbi:CDP-alcohol phosphatidyltransferase family protein [Flavobacterium sp.]